MKKTKEDIIWRKAVIERDKGCIICGKSGKYLNAHHLIPWQFTEWRTDIDNGVTLCPHHHTLNKFSAHLNPMWFSRWMRIHKNKIYQIVIRRLREFDET